MTDDLTPMAQAAVLAVSVDEAGRRLGIGRTAAYGLVASGRLASYREGSRRLVPVSALEQYVAERAAEAAEAATA